MDVADLGGTRELWAVTTLWERLGGEVTCEGAGDNLVYYVSMGAFVGDSLWMCGRRSFEWN